MTDLINKDQKLCIKIPLKKVKGQIMEQDIVFIRPMTGKH